MTARGAASAGVLLVALGLRLWRLDFESFWFDEVASLDEARVSVGAILGRLYWPPVYSLLLKPLVAVTTNEAVLRLPAALFGALGVFVFHRSLARAYPLWISGGVALLFATSAFHLELSQQVRHYTLGILLLWLTHDAYRRLLRDAARWRAGLVWAAWAVLTYLTIFLALPLLAVQTAHGVFTQKGHARRRFVVAAIAVFAVLSPWLIGSTAQADRVPTQLRYAGGHLEGLVDALTKTYFGYLRVPPWLAVAGLAALAAILVAGLVRERVRLPTVTLLSFSGMLLGIGILTAFVSDPYPRYFTLTLPFFFALLATSLSNLPARVARAILAVLLVVSTAEGVHQLRARQHPDWRGVAARLAEPGFPACALVLGMPNMEKGVMFYLRRDHPGVEPEVYALAGGYTLDEAGARAIRREIDAIAERHECLVYIRGFEWFSDPEHLVLQYLMYRYPWSIEVSRFPAASAFRLRDPEE